MISFNDGLPLRVKFPWMQFYVNDWLSPDVGLCRPETRGIWMEWLCQMHLLDRSGLITGTREQLAALGRCTVAQVESTLADLVLYKTADVTFRNDVVTVINRRMKREYKARKDGALRVNRHRSKGACNGDVTGHKSEVRSHKSYKIEKEGSASPPCSRFQKPDMPSLELYAAKIGLPVLEVNKFVDYYEANGWRVGKNPMKSWEAAMRNWQRNFRTYGSKINSGNTAKGNDRNAGTYNASTSNDGLKSKVR